MDYLKEAEQIILLCRRFSELGYLSGADGNISMRLDDGLILITPRGRPKWTLAADDLALMDSAGLALRGEASSEKLLHLEVYNRSATARVVAHTHPPIAVAWTVARPELRELPTEGLTEIIIACGRIPIAPYALPGSAAMAAAVGPLLPQCRAIILARHGALSWGEDLIEAANGMERIEHAATILKAAHELGGITSLTNDEVAELRRLREKIGEKVL